MKLLNNSDNNHIDEIHSCLARAKTAYFAIAFLKESGLNHLESNIKNFLDKGGKLTIIAGLNFGFTDSTALRNLFMLFRKYKDSYLYMYRGGSNSIFHPKLYLFENQKNCSIICGSANMTLGGFSTNSEISLSVKCIKTDDIWKSAKSTFNNYLTNASIATILEIDRYKSFQDTQNKVQKMAQATYKNNFQFDFNILEKYATREQLTALQISFKNREQDYTRAKQYLNEILYAERLTKNIFEQNFLNLIQGHDKCWHSGGLSRQKGRIINNFLHFRDLIRHIKENINASPSQLFQSVMKMKREKGKLLIGVGANYFTEIMCTYSYEKFAVLNNNPFTVLTKEVRYFFNRETLASFNGEDYEKFCEVCREVQNHFNFKNLLEVDCFFNEIYWQIKQKNIS